MDTWMFWTELWGCWKFLYGKRRSEEEPGMTGCTGCDIRLYCRRPSYTNSEVPERKHRHPFLCVVCREQYISLWHWGYQWLHQSAHIPFCSTCIKHCKNSDLRNFSPLWRWKAVKNLSIGYQPSGITSTGLQLLQPLGQWGWQNGATF